MAAKKTARSRRFIESLESRRLLATIYVDASVHASSPDGTSWQTAYGDLQQALGIAQSGDQIHIADGIYLPTSGSDRTIAFQLNNGIKVYGGFAGYGASNPDARDTVNTPTILSGNIGASGVSTDNSYHVVITRLTDATTVLDGVTISDGYADGTGNVPVNQTNFGAGMIVDSGNPTINNCTFTSNNVNIAGPNGQFLGLAGAVMVTQDFGPVPAPTFSNCQFIANFSCGGGGAVADFGGSTYINCLFRGNSAAGSGGAFDSQGQLITLLNCTMTANSAPIAGGLEIDNPSPTITNCIIYGNTASLHNPDYEAFGSSAPTFTYSDVNGVVRGMGNINTDPLFVDPGANNYQLQQGSPCINSGDNTVLPASDTLDLAGNLRIQFGTIDVGAYESTVDRGIFVDASATGTNNGTSWTNAYTDLAPALAAAPSGANILVAKGTYNHSADQNPFITYLLKSGVGVYGGYQGGSVNPFSRDVVANATILDGQHIQAHVVTARNDATGTILDGFEIENGYGPSAIPPSGAGLQIDDATVTINNCEFVNDYTSGVILDWPGYGGGVYSEDFAGTSASITNSTFINCTAAYGGAIANLGSMSVSGCTFTSNTAYLYGGAIASTYGATTVTNCSFSKNTAEEGGGAVYTAGSSLTVTGSSFTGNTATDVSVHGIGIEASGGAINAGSSPTLVNDSFSLNSAYSCGAASLDGIFLVSGPTVTNCVFWGNTATGGNWPDTFADATYSDLTTPFPDTGDINLNPLFVDAAHGNLQLQPGSPCIDVGSNAAVNVSTDLAGNPRIVAGTVDMGAYESQVTFSAQSGSYLYNLSRPAVSIMFSADIDLSTLSAGDLVLTNTTTSETINTASLATVSYDSPSHTATWAFNTSLLPNGDYTATIAAGSVQDASSDALSADFSFNFFALAGDANHDGVVNVADLVAAAQNWQKTGKTFSQGDFNYDGNVDLADLRILAANWGKTSTGLSQAPLLSPLLTMLALPATADPASSEPQQSATDTEVASDPVVAPASVIPTRAPAPTKRAVSHTSSISGSVFNDRNRDGKRKGKDAGLAGWRVFIDSNNDGILDDGETSVLTDAKGNWKISGLAAGTYSVRIVPGKRWTVTTSNGPSVKVKLAAGAKVDHKLFGVFHLA